MSGNLRVQYRCSRGHYVTSTRRDLEDNRCTAWFGEVVCDGTLGGGLEMTDDLPDRLHVLIAFFERHYPSHVHIDTVTEAADRIDELETEYRRLKEAYKELSSHAYEEADVIKELRAENERLRVDVPADIAAWARWFVDESGPRHARNPAFNYANLAKLIIRLLGPGHER